MATEKSEIINKAAYLTAPKAKPLKVDNAPYTSPKAGELTVRNRAIAVNPVDRIKQDSGNFLYGWLKYPIILGFDLAGEVVEVGKDVTAFKLGDRVLGFASGMDKPRNSPAESAFQLYTVLPETLVSHIPDGMSFESAAVIPLGMATAACGLYEKDQLGLQYPSFAAKLTGKALIIWGGATSVGCNAIQLAVASGYEVVTTCSPRNFALCKRLGASHCFDYNSPTVVADMVAVLKDKILAGGMAIGDGGAEACSAVMQRVKCYNKFVALASYPTLNPPPKTLFTLRTALHFISWNIRWWISSRRSGVRSKFIWGSSMAYNNISRTLFGSFLPMVLAERKYVAAPEPQVVGHGLEYIQEALELQKTARARKMVVSL